MAHGTERHRYWDNTKVPNPHRDSGGVMTGAATHPPASPPDPGKAAAWYARRLGWAVLPVHFPDGGRCSCGNPGCTRVAKHPCLPNGVHGASRDPGVVAGWWRDGRPWNVAIATGVPSGVWVLDVDGAAGCATMRELGTVHGELPVTVTAETGGGGLHLFWRMPQDQAVGCRVGAAPHVDVRGTGGYVVTVPSRHASGRQYVWHKGCGPHQVAIAAAPAWLLDVALGRISAAAGQGERNDWARLFGEEIPEGGRNHALAQRAGYLLRLGVDSGAAVEILLAWSRAHCKPPLSDEEIRQTVNSVARREKRRRMTVVQTDASGAVVGGVCR